MAFLAADLHLCRGHMGGDHFDNIRCLILHLAFRKYRCIVFCRIYNDAAPGGDCFQTILPCLAGGTVSLRNGNAVLIQDIMQWFFEDRIVRHLLFAFDKKRPGEI